jgi:hypothetical protein
MDIQFVQFNDALSVTSAREVPDLSPRSVQITGPDFRHAIEVLINEENSPSFVVASKTVLIAQVPSTQKKSVIRSRVQFRLGKDPKKATGLKSMMQTFLKILFTTAGTDAFAQRIGGSGLKNIGRNFSLGDTQSIVSDFAISIRLAESQMKALQSQQPRLPDTERLLSANIVNSTFDVQLSALLARVELISQSGTRAIANLEL